jgi:hypothetical protein
LPSKGKTRVSAAQRRKIAAGRLAGKTHKVIAQETGLAHSTVRKQAADRRTQTYMQVLLDRKQEPLDRTWEHIVKWLEKDANSKDAVIRAQARRDFARLIQAGDPPMPRMLPPTEAPPNSLLLEEYLMLYRKFELAK